MSSWPSTGRNTSPIASQLVGKTGIHSAFATSLASPINATFFAIISDRLDTARISSSYVIVI